MPIDGAEVAKDMTESAEVLVLVRPALVPRVNRELALDACACSGSCGTDMVCVVTSALILLCRNNRLLFAAGEEELLLVRNRDGIRGLLESLPKSRGNKYILDCEGRRCGSSRNSRTHRSARTNRTIRVPAVLKVGS